MTSSGAPRPSRAGRMAGWQRRYTYTLLGFCAASGVAWFFGLDLLNAAPPALRWCWVLHGVSGLLAALAIGAAVPQHALITWRARRNRLLGVLLGITLAMIMFSSLCLQYGLEAWHDTAHWVHVVLGLTAAAVLPLHIWQARRAARLSAARHA